MVFTTPSMSRKMIFVESVIGYRELVIGYFSHRSAQIIIILSVKLCGTANLGMDCKYLLLITSYSLLMTHHSRLTAPQ